jgi:hypothetical protein
MKASIYIRGIRFEDICNASHYQASNESEIPDIFPALFHVFLAGFHAEEPSGGWVVVVAMIGGTEIASCREALRKQRSPKQTTRP